MARASSGGNQKATDPVDGDGEAITPTNIRSYQDNFAADPSKQLMQNVVTPSGIQRRTRIAVPSSAMNCAPSRLGAWVAAPRAITLGAHASRISAAPSANAASARRRPADRPQDPNVMTGLIL